jgi:allatostatin receptor
MATYTVAAQVQSSDQLPYLNATNFTKDCNGTCPTKAQPDGGTFEQVVQVVVPIVFGLILVLGFVGNLLVIIVVISNKQMRNTTNLLIINLAIADLVFIIICVPFTAMEYALTVWPFGDVWCKVYQYTIHVTAYASVYTLVLMSLDRYLAVVHPITSMSIRTERNAYFLIFLSWVIICLGNMFMFWQYKYYPYSHDGEDRSMCVNFAILQSPTNGRIFYGIFFCFGYCIPLATVCVLYGLMLKRLLYGVVPGIKQSMDSIRSKKRISRMVIIVVVIFAICWLPVQVLMLVQHFGNQAPSYTFVGIGIASRCIAYMNSCVNPILYAFLSENFRKSFKKLLCISKWQPVRQEVDRLEHRVPDPATRITDLSKDCNSCL